MAVNPTLLVSKVELFVTLSGLPSMDLLSLPDAYCIVSAWQGAGWADVGRTEVVTNNAAPRFSTAVPIDFRFEEVQVRADDAPCV